MKHLTVLEYRRKFNTKHYAKQLAKINHPDFPKDNLYMWMDIESGEILPEYNPRPTVKSVVSTNAKKLEAIAARHSNHWDWHKFSTKEVRS